MEQFRIIWRGGVSGRSYGSNMFVGLLVEGVGDSGESLPCWQCLSEFNREGHRW